MLCTGRSRRAYCGAVLAALFRCIIFLCHSMLDGNVGEEEEVQQPLECCRGRCRHGDFFSCCVCFIVGVVRATTATTVARRRIVFFLVVHYYHDRFFLEDLSFLF